MCDAIAVVYEVSGNVARDGGTTERLYPSAVSMGVP
jgi:hypothetical protein